MYRVSVRPILFAFGAGLASSDLLVTEPFLFLLLLQDCICDELSIDRQTGIMSDRTQFRRQVR